MVVIHQGFLYRFAHGLEAGEMHHGFKLVLGKQLAHAVAVAHVDFDKAGAFTADLFNAVEHRCLAVAEVVRNQDFMALSHEFDHSMRTDITRAAGHQDHGCTAMFWLEASIQ